MTSPQGPMPGAGAYGAYGGPTQNGQAILQRLRYWATQYGMSDKWVQASLAIAANESGFSSGAINDGSVTHTDEYSIGPWQINYGPRAMTEERFPKASARDPILSTDQRIPELIKAWNALGGDKAYNEDYLSFWPKYHEKAQVSWVPNAKQTADAFQMANQVMGLAPPSTAYQSGGLAHRQPEAPLDPAATPVDALNSLIAQQIRTIQTSGGDPLAQNQALLNLANTQRVLTTMQGTPSPDVVAQIAASAGISANTLAAEEQRLKASQAFTAGQNALQRASTEGMSAAQLAVQLQGIGNTYQVDMARLGFDQQKFGQQVIVDNATVANMQQITAQNAQRLGLDTELGRGQLQLGKDKLALDQQLGLGQLDLGNRRLGLDTTIAQQANDIARENLGVNREQLGLQKDLGYANLDLARQTGLREDRKAHISALVDLLGTQVEAGKMTADLANEALRTQLQAWKTAPLVGGFMPGFEPGGAYSQIVGSGYNESALRVRPFPTDLNTLIQAGAKPFNMSDAWAKAKDLLAGEFPSPSGPATPAPGGAAVSTSAPGAPSAPQTATAAPTAPTTATTSPVSPAQPVQQPAVAPPQPIEPSQTPSTAPTVPQCPPGFQASWDGTSYSCTPLIGQPQPAMA